jgi:diguanylate cyclase (GGDEF)-like protein/PAS domain S-box-containing protein
MSLWESHAVTIVFSAVVATAGARWATRAQARLHARLVEQVAARERLEARGAALAESAARYRAIVEGSPDATFVHTAGRVVYVNPACARLLGAVDPNALVGRTVVEFVHADHRAAAGAYLEALYSGAVDAGPERDPVGHDAWSEFSLLDAAGERRVVEAASVRVTWESAPAIQTHLRDVTARRRAERALGQSHALLAATLEATGDAILVIDPAGRVTGHNRTLLALWGIPPEVAAAGDGPRLLDHVLARLADPEAFLARLHGTPVTANETFDDVLHFTDGRVVERHSQPQRAQNGTIVGRVFSFRDVTERVRAAEAIVESEARLRLALEAARMTVWERTLGEERVTFRAAHVASDRSAASAPTSTLTSAATTTAGSATTRTEEPAAARGFLDTVHPDDREHVLVASRQARAAHGTLDVEFRHRAADGTWRWRHTKGRVFPPVDGTPARMVGVDLDVTERKRLEADLAYQAFHDSLTGLANRALFRDRLAHAIARVGSAREGRTEHVAVLYLDLDDFKHVNDSHGHAAGDRLLQSVAERLLRATRGFDTVARLGGDEFAVLLEGLGAPEEADLVVARVLRTLAPAITAEGRALTARASVGLVHATPHATAEELLRDADVAMYAAKAAGKGQATTFAPAMREAVLDRRALEQDLRAAVETAVSAPVDARGASLVGTRALHLVYQPIVALATGAVIKFEALLRWQHPTRGAVSPASFVPIAEEAGLIVPLGRWVLREACRQLAAWDITAARTDAGGWTGGPEVTTAAEVVPTSVAHLAVNVSGRQLEDTAFVGEVAAALAEYGVAPGRLTLEVTETALMRDTARTMAALHALKALGVRLAIDDFGTGYSSLAYLQRFPVDLLKIDKTFVDGVARGGPDAALVRTVIALGQTLGLTTVAEGVETAAQREALAALGCTLGQGYLFARPLDADTAGQLVARAAARDDARTLMKGH